jgi:tetratricopeptide (TPR) repeat protein
MKAGATEHSQADHSHGDGGHAHGEGAHGPAQLRISRRDRAIVVVVPLLLFVLLFRSQLAFLTAWRADSLIVGGKEAHALSVLRRGLLLTPGDPTLLDMAGFAMERRGDYQGAEAAYRKVFERRPDSALTWRSLGAIYAWQGRWADASAAYERAVALGPEDGLAWRGLALSQERSGELEAAADTWKRYAARFPGGDGRSQATRVRRLLEGRE